MFAVEFDSLILIWDWKSCPTLLRRRPPLLVVLVKTLSECIFLAWRAAWICTDLTCQRGVQMDGFGYVLRACQLPFFISFAVVLSLFVLNYSQQL